MRENMALLKLFHFIFVYLNSRDNHYHAKYYSVHLMIKFESSTYSIHFLYTDSLVNVWYAVKLKTKPEVNKGPVS